jgi:hypothetical protein
MPKREGRHDSGEGPGEVQSERLIPKYRTGMDEYLATGARVEGPARGQTLRQKRTPHLTMC